MEQQFSECFKCGKPINHGEAYVSISRSVEQAHFDLETNISTVTVIDAVGIIELCGSCGNKFNAGAISDIIKVIPDNSRVNNN
jgi:hypothetical protein